MLTAPKRITTTHKRMPKAHKRMPMARKRMPMAPKRITTTRKENHKRIPGPQENSVVRHTGPRHIQKEGALVKPARLQRLRNPKKDAICDVVGGVGVHVMYDT